MPRRMPSLNALKAFEAAARHESFTTAAGELNVTQGAISHQVKALEEDLGLRLFIRRRHRLELTEAARSYLPVVREAFDRIARGAEDLMRRQSSGVLTVSTSSSFASRWLVPRLGDFSKLHPGIDLRLGSSAHLVDFAREDIDMAVRYGTGDWPGVHAVRLTVEEMFAVCSPGIAARISHADDLAGQTLLHVDNYEEWRRWKHELGYGFSVDRGPIFTQDSLPVDAAMSGQGVAMTRTTLAMRDLLAGRLVRPFTAKLPLDKGYWVVSPKATADLPKIKAFRDWLLAEMAADQEALAASP
ncbi:transcriptional regulator GcvA [Lacibacterium aquatile]|uniref:Transcriptional regulator GcvA n=1 Tax=Lacibacterium aquatile TaxID=1168082 RepID=A0ABW5DXK2_9PROT